MKLLFAPIGILAGWLAGLTGRRLTDRLWGLVDDHHPPRSDERAATWPRLIGALLIEGAVFRLVRGLTDHAARRGFARFTGRWPGKDAREE
jgi:hypothetical protein